MATFKNRHNGNFTQISNAVIHSGISPAALGALVMLLSHGANWKLNVTHFQKEMGIGERATRTIINELTKAGHIEEIKDRDEKGRYKPTIYNIYETPKTKQENQPEGKNPPVKKDPQQSANAENPHSENASVDNDDAIPYYSNKEAIKKDSSVIVEAEKAEPARLPHGKHHNVFLTDDEYKILVETYGNEQTDYSIDTLSNFKKKSAKCKKMNDFRQLMDKWIKQDIEWGKIPKTYSSARTPEEKSDIRNNRYNTGRRVHYDADFDVEKYKKFVNDFKVI